MVDSPIPALLDADSEFCGTVHLSGPARIDGCVEGDVVSSAQVWIGASGRVHARVHAAELIVEGTLEGEIRATHRVELRANARVIGNLETPRLQLAEGAFFEGRCTTRAPLPIPARSREIADSVANSPADSP